MLRALKVVKTYPSTAHLGGSCPHFCSLIKWGIIWWLMQTKNHGRVKGTESKQLNRVQCELEFLQCFQINHLRYRIWNSSGKRVSVKISASIRKKNIRECVGLGMNPRTQKKVEYGWEPETHNWTTFGGSWYGRSPLRLLLLTSLYYVKQGKFN